MEEGQVDFHSACTKKLFNAAQLPEIHFDMQDLEEMARQNILKSKAITGVQAKLSINVEKHRNEPSRLTIVGLHGDYILKPPSTHFKELPENEDLTMHLAELIKIKTAKHALIRLKSGELAYITQRFDRNKTGKIAVEDFCQLSENLTEHKYRGSIEKVGKLMRSFTFNKGFESQRLFELVLFCYLTGNADMHLKNFSLIENSHGEFELSPAYDLNPSIDKVGLAINIDTENNTLDYHLAFSVGEYFQLLPHEMEKILKEVLKAVKSWKKIANDIGISRAEQEIMSSAFQYMIE